jgi:MFS family permease
LDQDQEKDIKSSKRPSGMFGLTIFWLGQIVSVLASMMTQFALTIWAFEKTGSATALGLVQVFFVTPFLLISPLAGALVDRKNRKTMMMVSDLSAGIATVGILVLQAIGILKDSLPDHDQLQKMESIAAD